MSSGFICYMADFATSSDMINRYDARTLGDLCSDDGEKVAEGDLDTNTKLSKLLTSATGDVVAAVLQGERYTRAELEALTGDAKEYLVDVTCQVCFGKLWRRKPYTDSEQRRESLADAEEILESLRLGTRVFDISRQQDAGTAKVASITRTEIASDWSLFVDQARGRFYPARRTFKQR